LEAFLFKTVRVVALAAALALPAAATAAPPKRIVSLSPTATEILFAIGAGPQVVAVDDQSSFPATAPRTKLSGFKPNIEAIAKYRPDLVVVSDDIDKVVSKLGKLKIRVVRQGAAANISDTYRQIAQLGALTGRSARATRLVGTMRTRMATLVASVKGIPTGKTYYHELDPLFFSVTSKTFIGTIYGKLGLKNIADGAGTTAYPQLSAEAIVAANPDFVFLADTKCCGQTLATVAARPGFANIAAVKNGNVVALNDDVASRWGPRIVDFAALVAGRLKAAAGT
jgi:iron complex transport system substrate-binding protein